MKTLRLSTVCLLALSLLAPPLRADDWPQWRGPNRDDVSKETGLLKQWPAGGPKLVWLFKDAGIGYSGHAIVKGRLFTMGARNGMEQLIAVDTTRGTQLWATDVGPEFQERRGNGPRSTPTVDGDRVYALSANGHLICANAADGKELWKVRFSDYGGRRPNWAFSESVLVDGNLVICTPGGGQGTLLALDKATGKKVWQTADWTDQAHYASPIVVNHNGARQYVQLTAQTLAGVNAKDGRVLWRSAWEGRTAVVPTPIFKDGHVYISSGYGVGCKLVKLGPGHAVEDVYRNTDMVNHHGGVVLAGDHLYGFSDGSRAWTCQEFKTGKVAWTSRNLGKGAITCADGMLYCLEESRGTVALIEASPKGWVERGRFTLTPQSEYVPQSGKFFWTHPVVANGKLYLRDHELLFCFDVSGRNLTSAR